MPLDNIIERRRKALLAAWRSNPVFLIQVDLPATLGQIVYLGDDALQDGAVGPVGRRGQTDVVCVTRAGDPDINQSVWVAKAYDYYRRAYLAFIRTAYGITATMADLEAYDVDHLLNRARSPKGTTFIRIEAVHKKINQAWGSLYERAASNPAFHANRVREKRSLSWMVASKLAGQGPPQGPNDQAGIKRLVRFWVGQGFPDEQVMHGLTEDLAFVFGLPRGGVIQPTTRWI